MKLITLTQGKFAQVDDDDYEWLNQWKWHVQLANNKYYVVGYLEKDKYQYMHRVIMGIKDKNIFIDHKDKNPLNNQRDNLRIATRSENNINRIKYSGISKYKGVNIQINRRGDKVYTYWIAVCTKDKKIYKKSFKEEKEAALWYNQKAKELHGEFAVLNIIE